MLSSAKSPFNTFIGESSSLVMRLASAMLPEQAVLLHRMLICVWPCAVLQPMQSALGSINRGLRVH